MEGGGAESWAQIGRWGRVAVLGAVVGALLGAGWRLRADDGRVLPRLASVLWFAAVAAWAGLLAVLLGGGGARGDRRGLRAGGAVRGRVGGLAVGRAGGRARPAGGRQHAGPPGAARHRCGRPGAVPVGGGGHLVAEPRRAPGPAAGRPRAGRCRRGALAATARGRGGIAAPPPETAQSMTAVRAFTMPRP